MLARCLALSILLPAALPLGAQPTTLQILGVRPDMAAVVPQPVQPDAAAAVPPDAELAARIHAGGRKTALIVRGGKFGINESALAILKRVADVFGVDPAVQRFIRDYLQKPYISDDELVKARLVALGYHVEHKTSLDYAANLARMKDDVLEALRRPETTLVVFYGHGSTWGAWLTQDRENNVPGLAEILRRPEARHPDQVVSVDDFKAALGGRKLDGMIMHGCQQGTNPYLKEVRGTVTEDTFSDLVRPDGLGFYAGWVTYSVYLDPQTLPVLERYLQHVATRDRLPAGARQRSSRYWMRAAEMGRKMAMLAFGSDGSSLDENVLTADPEVHGHTMDYYANVVPLRLFIDLLHDIKLGDRTLAEDFRTFLSGYYAYAVAAGLPMRQDGQGTPPVLPARPTTADYNRLLSYHGGVIAREALQAIAPGMVALKQKRTYFSDAAPGSLFADLVFELRKAGEVDEALRLLRGLHEQTLVDGISSGVRGGIGPQLGGRIASTLDAVQKSLDDQVVACAIELSLEKVRKAGGSSNVIRPIVHGYNICVGDLSLARRDSREAPYELHVSLATVDRLAARMMRGLFSVETKVYASRLVDLYARLWKWNGIVRVDDRTLWLRTRWEVRGDWALVSDGYGYLEADVFLRLAPGGALKVEVSPSARIKFLSGWPFPDWVGRIVAGKVSRAINDEIHRRIGTVDFATVLPAEFKSDIAGVVKIDRLGFDWEALNVLIRRE